VGLVSHEREQRCFEKQFEEGDRHGVSQADYVDIPDSRMSFLPRGSSMGSLLSDALGANSKQKDPIKQQLTLRLNAEVVDFFRSKGSGWQSSINKALLEYMQTHKPA
jgi:uncharacterized protein (DUF4415 family)